jgi:pyruvate/2-oxoglutarate dehydrogenase complex dihydrolipoamide acyltransferase (E2) component
MTIETTVPVTHPNGIATVVPRVVSRARLAGMKMTLRSAQIPTFQVCRTLDLAPALAGRTSTYTATEVLIIAAARALRLCPAAHTCLVDDRVHEYTRTRIGILVRNHDALLPLVFVDAELSCPDVLRAERAELEVQLSSGRLPAERTLAPTFVISNLGNRSVDWFTAVLFPDTAMTLAVGSLGAPGLTPYQCRAVLTCDHRLVDGLDGAELLDAMGTCIPDPHHETRRGEPAPGRPA